MNKLRDSSLDTPDFQANFTERRQYGNNALVRGALRSKTGISDLHIGSCWGTENGNEPLNQEGDQDSVILNTRADAVAAGLHPETGEYNRHHQDEEALAKALDKLDVQYERGPFRDLYRQAYQTKYE